MNSRYEFLLSLPLRLVGIWNIYFEFINTISSESDCVSIEGGLTIAKRKETTTAESPKFTCSNPSCRKVFANPIKAKNLASKETEPYYACPYCLTEIVVLEETASIEEKEQKPEAEEIELKEPSMHSASEKPTEPQSKPQNCAHFFGYLSQRTSKEKIPEECMVCENIVQCMLKKVTG
jgi:hypothetical protein